MGTHRITLQLSATDSDATLVRILGIICARRARIHAVSYQVEAATGPRLSVEVEPTNCRPETLGRLLRGVVGVLGLDLGPVRSDP